MPCKNQSHILPPHFPIGVAITPLVPLSDPLRDVRSGPSEVEVRAPRQPFRAKNDTALGLNSRPDCQALGAVGLFPGEPERER